MGRISTSDLNAEILRFVAKVLFTASAGRAITTSNPWISNALVPNCDTFSVGSNSDHFAFNLMTECEGEFPTAAHIELIAATHVEMPVMQVYV
tara:strand:+ start:303 stop:581 length:279 start_codon:yes stop_codon:yes gene_type:complete